MQFYMGNPTVGKFRQKTKTRGTGGSPNFNLASTNYSLAFAREI